MTLDLTGQKYGRLTVIKEVERKGYTRRWQCKCDCGNERVVVVTQPNLRNNHTTSCGCVRKEKASISNSKDLVSKRFGKLTVVQSTDKRINRKIVWECKCDCGELTNVSTDKLLLGTTTSCGCARVDAGIQVQQKLQTDLTVDGVIIPTLTRKARIDNKTGVKGVSLVPLKNGTEKYKAMISIKGKTIYLGRFDTLEEAKIARKKAEEHYHKPYIDSLEDTEK
ncbi:hypothetical protein [Lysinibacillus sp. OF-1]|uniref:hypothetical protein n=1 Tax=Lysinibacillus sp. OF-1 TaxID=2972483 RepID=UPI00232D874C|nr:hypothetical protein [Lysinibacillus sp. OF-1]WCH46367.1 hypothetical protein NV349_14870 [Lysinibacillus sp. OF-1]